MAHTLRNGASAIVRPICPRDAPKLAEGMARLSKESRFDRFLHNKDHYSPGELRRLTRQDARRHLALVLAIVDERGRETDVVGVARCFREASQPTRGEVTVTTRDDWQHQGVATALVRELAGWCLAHGISTWQAVTLRKREAGIRRLLNQVGVPYRDGAFGESAVEIFYVLDMEKPAAAPRAA